MPCKNEARKRPLTIAFRITPELNKQINLLVAASGMTKQDFITSKLMDLEVTIVPSCNTYVALRDEMREVCRQLNRIRKNSPVDPDLLALCDKLADLFLGLRADDKQADVEIEDLAFHNVERF